MPGVHPSALGGYDTAESYEKPPNEVMLLPYAGGPSCAATWRPTATKARNLSDGNLEFLGRLDHQGKSDHTVWPDRADVPLHVIQAAHAELGKIATCALAEFGDAIGFDGAPLWRAVMTMAADEHTETTVRLGLAWHFSILDEHSIHWHLPDRPGVHPRMLPVRTTYRVDITCAELTRLPARGAPRRLLAGQIPARLLARPS